MEERLTSFEEFWPFYVAQHLNPANRALHFLGTSLALWGVSPVRAEYAQIAAPPSARSTTPPIQSRFFCQSIARPLVGQSLMFARCRWRICQRITPKSANASGMSSVLPQR